MSPLQRERALCWGVALAFIAPLLLTRYFPGLDLPWHGAICAVLHTGDAEVEPRFLGQLTVDSQLSSYLTLYVSVDALARVVGDVALAMQVVIVLYVVAFVLSARSLVRAFGGDGGIAVLAAPAAFSVTLQFGFLSYALAFPMTLWSWALLVRLFALAPAPLTAFRLVGVLALSALIALTHPFAAAVALAGSILLVLLHAGRTTWGRAVLAVAALIAGAVPSVLAVALIGGGPADGGAVPMPPLPGQGLLAQLGALDFTPAQESLAAAPAWLFGFVPEGARFALVAAGLMAVVVARHQAGAARAEVPSSAVRRAPVYLAAVLLAIYLLTPYTLEWPRRWFGAQPRLLPLLWVVAVAALAPRPTTTTRRAHWRVLAAPLAVSAIALVLLATTTLLPFATEAWDLRAIVTASAPRARTLALIEQPPTEDRAPAGPWRHAADYLMVEQGGVVSNLPFLGSSAGNAGVLVPVRRAASAPPMPAAPGPGQPRTFDWERHAAGWDQIVIRDLDPAEPWPYFAGHEDGVELISRAGRWRLFRVIAPNP